ncbi:YiiX/YebB-like N1pC/P60 family cysteine hydrolase [Thermococcus sp.]|uniref:YiiX/YebB-like N1pC/P60 family cysteine hydrolase n=1 Tax=Thermococcus sp. TaxID=35749 RepID=UPI0026121AE1|nr:YiiX/YebB-like N1pC/P60 family cysteine hydrolase [Thermococcus sp.]
MAKMRGRLITALFLTSLVLGMSMPSVAALDLIGSIIGGTTEYNHPYPTDVIPGDIIIGHNPVSDLYIPGYWTHTGLVAYYDDSLGEWMIIEAWDDPSAVRIVTMSDFLKRYDEVAILRVKTTDDVRQKAIAFAMQQLGKPYDWLWFFKEVYGDSYYCSELVWASYIAAGGPDVDANPGFTWTYFWGVAPQEIYDDDDTYVVYQHHA